MWDTVNLAARMESASEPGTILSTEQTHKLIAPLFESEALGSIQVKGNAERVPVYRILAAEVVPASCRASRAGMVAGGDPDRVPYAARGRGALAERNH